MILQSVQGCSVRVKRCVLATSRACVCSHQAQRGSQVVPRPRGEPEPVTSVVLAPAPRSSIGGRGDMCSLAREFAHDVHSMAWGLWPDLVGDALEKCASTRLKQRLVDNEATLKQAIPPRRSLAGSLTRSYGSLRAPLSQKQRISWLRRRRDDFFMRTSEAGARRRAASLCLHGASDTPTVVPRLGCRGPCVRFAQLPHWQQFLVGRVGWDCQGAF